MVTIPGTKELLVVGGSRDLESDLVSDQVLSIRENEILPRKPLSLARSKIALAVAKTQDQHSTKHYVFAVGG